MLGRSSSLGKVYPELDIRAIPRELLRVVVFKKNDPRGYEPRGPIYGDGQLNQ